MKAMALCGVFVSLMVVSCTGLFNSGFDKALFEKEKAAWEAQGIRHYRYRTTKTSDAAPDEQLIESTVFPDREPEVIARVPDVIAQEQESPNGWYPIEEGPFYGRTIDEFYQYIADDVKGSIYSHFSIRYNKQYHYPEYYFSAMKYPWVGGHSEIEITEFESLGE